MADMKHNKWFDSYESWYMGVFGVTDFESEI